MERGVPGIVLMENAGRGAAHLIGLKARPRAKTEAPRTGSNVAGTCIRCADERSLEGLTFVVLAGGGNNGGDGFVVARHLACRAATLRVVSPVAEDEIRGDALLALRALTATGLVLEALPDDLPALFESADLVVDALLGTGADRPVTGIHARLIEALNTSRVPTIALDVPSGLHAETGVALGPVVQAFHTVTFAHLKKGLLTTEGHRCSGDITVSHIGVPSELPFDGDPAGWLIEEGDLRARIAKRSPVAHKASAGRVVLLAGSPGTVGAARLSARGSLRAGAGLVTICTRPQTAAELEQETEEVMTRAWAFDDGGAFEETTASLLRGSDALVIGPGLGRDEEAAAALWQALSMNRPTVIDADALRILADAPLAERNLSRFGSSCLAVLTPHPGEAGALLGFDAKNVEADRFSAAERLAEVSGSVVILKGSRTIIAAPGRTPVVSAFGSPAMATAGSGDVLSGICGALLVGAENVDEVFERAQTAVALHGLAGQRWQQKHGDRGLLASEIADLVPEIFLDLLPPQ